MNCEILRFASKMPKSKGGGGGEGGHTQLFRLICSLVHYRFIIMISTQLSVSSIISS